MSRTTSSSGPIVSYAPGSENFNYAVLFDANSTSNTSQTIVVDNNFVRVAAFNLSPGETITIEQITGLGAGSASADYAPISGHVQLFYNSATDQRTSYVLERPGRYRAVLSSGRGTVHAYAIQYFIENEASQDIADALYAVINQLTAITPCTFGAKIPRNQPTLNNVVQLDNTNCLIDAELVSPDAGNQVVLHANGVYVAQGAGGGSTPCTMGALIPAASTAPDNYVGKDGGSCLVDSQLVSSGAGNLIQLRADGLYYGIQPPANFANQYVSSSTGNDTNSGTIGSPLRTIQKAISNLPDGTTGNIYLLAGDTFHTYPTASGDTINTLTYLQSITQFNTLNINNRSVQFFPYNDTAINDIQAYNAANSTAYDPYIAAEINFPIVAVTLSLPTDSPTYIPLGFNVGTYGSLIFNAINFVVGQSGTVSPGYVLGGINGSGNVSFQGGHIIVGNVPAIGGPNESGTQTISFQHTQIADHATPSTPPLFCQIGAQYFLNTIGVVAPGGLVVPALIYTDIGDNLEVTTTATPNPASINLGGAAGTSAHWPGIVIYDHTTRAYKKVITSIDIQT